MPNQLPDSWNNAVTSISASYYKNSMKFAKIYEMIMTKEIRRMKLGDSNSGSTLNMDSRGRNRNCENDQRGRFKF